MIARVKTSRLHRRMTRCQNLFELAEWTLRRFLYLEEHQLAAATL
jgi:hypothetical protein